MPQLAPKQTVHAEIAAFVDAAARGATPLASEIIARARGWQSTLANADSAFSVKSTSPDTIAATRALDNAVNAAAGIGTAKAYAPDVRAALDALGEAANALAGDRSAKAQFSMELPQQIRYTLEELVRHGSSNTADLNETKLQQRALSSLVTRFDSIHNGKIRELIDPVTRKGLLGSYRDFTAAAEFVGRAKSQQEIAAWAKKALVLLRGFLSDYESAVPMAGAKAVGGRSELRRLELLQKSLVVLTDLARSIYSLGSQNPQETGRLVSKYKQVHAAAIRQFGSADSETDRYLKEAYSEVMKGDPYDAMWSLSIARAAILKPINLAKQQGR